MDNCLFCKIINKEVPAKIVYEDDDFLAFNDINPRAKTHILLITKKHIESAATVQPEDTDLIGRMVIKATKIAKELNLSTGYRLVLNIGSDSGAEVEHIHLHILGGNRLGGMA